MHALLGADMAVVDGSWRVSCATGLSPATESAVHLLEAGGKRVRPLTVLLAAACFGPPPPAARDLAVVAELVHLATLLHDDVIDDGQERRGRPTPRRIWGNAVSVLAGDLLLTHALERTSACGARARPGRSVRDAAAPGRRRGRAAARPDACSTRAKRSTSGSSATRRRRSSRGRRAPARPSPARAPRRRRRSATTGRTSGVAFQLVDDVLDYAGDPRATGKALLGDLAEGKLTLPLIRALAAHPALAADVEAVAVGRSGARPSALADAVRASGTCDGVRALAREETARALASLETLPAERRPRAARRGRARARVARGVDADAAAVTKQDKPRALWPTEASVSDVIGRLIEFWGFKRNMGRVWTVLYLSPEPLSAEDLRQALQLSSGAVSMTLSELSRWGVVRRVWIQGERKDFYTAEVQLWRMISRVFNEREKSEVTAAIDVFEEALEKLDRIRRTSNDPAMRARAELQHERISQLLELARLGRRLLDALVSTAKVDAEPLVRFLLGQRS